MNEEKLTVERHSSSPRVGFGLICAALILHLRPEVPDFAKR